MNDLASAAWRKSWFSRDECVEVMKADDRVLVRDSKAPDGAVLTFTRAEWSAFVRGVQEDDPHLT